MWHRAAGTATGLCVVLAGIWLAPVADAGAASRARLLRVVTPKDGRFVADQRQVTLDFTVRPGTQVRAVMLNGNAKRRLTRLVGASRVTLRSGRVRYRARIGPLKRGRNQVTVLVARGGRTDSEGVLVDRARRARTLIRRLRVSAERGTARVTLTPDRLRVSIRATLNGRRIDDEFEHGAPLRRAVSLSVRHGLRAGANVLRLRVKTFTGRYQTRTVRFRMPTSRPRAEAGPDAKERAGIAVRLNGSRSRLPRTSGRGARLSYRWRLVSAPPGSHPTLVDAEQARATLRTDRRYPGRYIARLTVTASGGGVSATATDTVTTTAQAQPRTAVQTFATAGGQAGIAIHSTLDCDDPTVGAAEPCFYANPGGAGQLQVLVLDRETLAPPTGYANYNRVYSTDDLSGFESQMSAFATTQAGATCKTYDSTKLVIVALRSGTIADTSNFGKAMNIFNVSTDAASASSASDCIAKRSDPSAGPFSLIGVPGTLAGKLWVNQGLAISSATGGDGIAGSMNGFFKEVSDDPSDSTLEVTHGFAYPDAIYFNTRAPGTDGNLNTADDVFVLGTETIPILPGGAPQGTNGGVSLISFDTVNPVGTLNVEAYATNAGNDSANGIDWTLLNSRLGDVMSNKPNGGKCAHCGVALVSYGQVGFHANEPLSQQFLAVLDKLEQLGVNPDSVARAINEKDPQAPGGYGWFSVLSANGIGYVASSSYANPGQSEDPSGYLKVYSGSLAGMLRRGHAAGLFPATADPTGVMQPDVMLPVIYGAQGTWLLTPALAATTACANDTTGPVAGCQATGEEVAFAYLVEQAFGKLFPDTPPSLWRPVGSQAAAARAAPRASASQSGGSRRADTLDGDGCATAPPPAPASDTTGAGTLVVDAGSVRDVSLILRSTYMSYTTTLNTDLVSSVNMPSGAAPFSAADLDCAKSQMLDELAARGQVTNLFDAVQMFENTSQSGIGAQLAKVAQDVESGQMSSIAADIHPQPRMDNSYWARLTMQWVGSISSVVDFFAGIDPIINQAYLWTALFSSAGETIMTTIEGPGGNPSRNLKKWASLAKQLEQEPVNLELQVSDTLAAQTNGVARTEEILLSGPAMLAATNQAAGTSFNFGANTADVFTAAQNAYYYNVRQMAYQSLWPQAYSAIRFSTDGICQTLPNGSKSCFTPSTGTWSNSSAVGLSQASQATCNNSSGAPFRNATSGTPVGFGQGTEYQALTSVAVDGGTPLGIDYVMVETDDLTASNLKSKYPTVADGDIVAPFFQQPSDSVSNQDPDAPPGFYAPDFWFQNLQPETAVTCGSGSPVMQLSSITGFYDQVAADDNSWPTAPYNSSTPCKYVALSGGTERAICTFDGTKNQFSDGNSLSVTDLILGVGGTAQASGVWLLGFGGQGGSANSPAGYHGGGGGANGVASTSYQNVGSLQAANRSSDQIWYYVGQAGGRGGSTYSGGSGGAATLIANANVNDTDTRPCIHADDNAVTQSGSATKIPEYDNGTCADGQTVIALAGAGGGGGTGGNVGYGGLGGYGAWAIASGKAVVGPGGTGASDPKGYEGVGGSRSTPGVGGRTSSFQGNQAGGDGIGGRGGLSRDVAETFWVNQALPGGTYHGYGGDGNPNSRAGGGGGGGFGGGGGGGYYADTYGGGGGGGGGSYAAAGQKPNLSAPSLSTSSSNGSMVIVIDEVDGPAVNQQAVGSLGAPSYSATTGERMPVEYGVNGPGRVTFILRRGATRIVLADRVRRAGTYTKHIRLGLRRGGKLRRLPAGRYELTLRFTDTEGNRARDTARVRIRG